MVIERHSFGGQDRHQPREEYLAQRVLEGLILLTKLSTGRRNFCKANPHAVCFAYMS